MEVIMRTLKKNSINNLAKRIQKDQSTEEYFFTSRNSKYKMDLEDRLYEINKNIRFKNKPFEEQNTKYNRRTENPFRFFI
jgi:hypothetical protein